MTTTAPSKAMNATTPAPAPLMTAPPPKKSPLASIRRGKIEQPLRIVIAGVEGVGKSTFAASAPNPVFIAADSGTAHLSVARLPEPKTWDDVLDSIRSLQSEPHDFRTLVVDSLTWIEPLLAAKVCADNKWESLETPGYGRGYLAALEQWRVFISEVERLWSTRAMHVIFVSHSAIKIFRNPTGEDYERYVLAITDKAAGLVKQWCDVCAFARHEAFAKRDAATKRVRGVSTGARVLHVCWDAAFDAKNRFDLPPELPLSWSAFYDAVRANGPERAAELRAQIAQQLGELDDRYVIEKAQGYVKDAGDDVARLAEIANAVAIKVDEKRNDQIPNA